MKRYIRKINATENIYGMSVDRKFLMGKLEGYADVIFEHILKIMAAPQTGNAKFIDKWIGDISKALFNVSKYTIKGNKRLTADVYKHELFDKTFGNEELDMMYHLEDFRDEYPEYSDFEIDDTMVKNLFNIITELREIIPPMIAEHTGDGIRIPKFKSIIRPIVNKYIPFETGADNWYK